ncbi:phosphosulfolactate synthase [Evansella caseinilytica]|uniref:Phosphosulfolactate synthase n=1 Tax=Evansella caseinilytica TaxID=1503961 RepID=A0A1H3PVR5_9BACI|nr:phosphosulfolactate synthase [Evansella caseinilytica]SDZ05136.1 phosphosulfolactate synthase [Evansella caseinilytica]
MNTKDLFLPLRQEKPRKHGLTLLIDNGVPVQFFIDTITSSAEFVDYVKFGWGTSVVTKHLREKIHCLKENDISFFFGGTLFEKFLSQQKIDDYYLYCREYGCRHVEISNGTISLPNKEKAKYITDFSKEFTVFSEVGSKDHVQSEKKDSAEWIECIQEDFAAGAYKVITETRESGTSGLCRENGQIRLQLVEDIVASGLNIYDIVFEAPTKALQTLFIKMIGSNVNLGNISFTHVIPVETLRLGLRSDTFNIMQHDFRWRGMHERQK